MHQHTKSVRLIVVYKRILKGNGFIQTYPNILLDAMSKDARGVLELKPITGRYGRLLLRLFQSPGFKTRSGILKDKSKRKRRALLTNFGGIS